MWKEINVKLDGYVIGTMANSKELKQGRQFTLPDNSVLTVQMASRAMSPELQVLRNGHPLPGSDSDPGKRLSVAYAIIFFIAGLNIVLGLIAVLTESGFLTERIGIDWTTIVFGMVFLLLGFLVRGRSVVALAVAVVLFIASGIWSFVVISQTMTRGTPPIGGIVMRIFLLIPMIQGFGALRELKANEQRQTAWPQ
jgi:hypothetical protein